MPFGEIRYEVADGVCTVTLNRPDRLNAVTATMLGELREAWDRADADDAVRAVIVTGAGRAFCAGPISAPVAPRSFIVAPPPAGPRPPKTTATAAALSRSGSST